MKKWLGEASAPKNDKLKSSQNKFQLNSKNGIEFYQCLDSDLQGKNMGLGVSSETPPKTNSQSSQSQDSSHISALRRCSGELSLHITSVNSRIQVSSPCHHFSTPTVSVQLHHPSSSCSTSGHQNQRLMSIISPGVGSIAIESPTTHQPLCSSVSHFHAHETETNQLISRDSPSLFATSDSHSLPSPLSSLHAPNESASNNAGCSSDSLLNSVTSHLQLPLGCSEFCITDSSSESESRAESSTGSCNSGLYGIHHPSSGSDYDITPLASASQTFHQGANHLSGSTAHAAAATGSSAGCGHWCSTCRVRVQVEVECVQSSQRSPNENRRGIKTLSLPKRTRPRHKVKAPNKDINSSHKKKKSHWPFRRNCRQRSNKNDELESALPSTNVGCASCVCPGYHRPETEPTYRTVVESGTSNNVTLHTPMVDLSRFNPEAYPINDIEETARQERAREMAEGVEPPPGFRSVPIIRPTQTSVSLRYRPLLDLQVLLENSLRLGLRGPRTNEISYHGEPIVRQIGSFTSDGTHLSRTVHTQVDYIHCLVPDLLAITNCGFYWGKMDRYEAERLLDNRAEGTFLLRDSAQEEYLFSVSFRRYTRSLHARIEQWNHEFSFDSHDPDVFASDTVCGLIEHYKDPSCCMLFEPLLTNPLARTFPFPLQHLCRATICSKTTYDGINGINNLDLPKSLKNYLKEYHYKQRVRVRHLD